MIQPVGAEVKVVELDNVWLQELKVMMEGGIWDGIGHSGIAKSWGYDNLSGGIYDDFGWFENGAYVVEGEHVVVMVDRQELDFWVGSEDYPHTVEYYFNVLENYVHYFDQAYILLENLFDRTPDPFFTDNNGRLVVLYMLAKKAGAYADYPITIGGGDLVEFELSTPFHEIGHTFTGGGKYSSEWWAEFCADYVIDNLNVEDMVYAKTLKSDLLEIVSYYESLGSPFENIFRGEVFLVYNYTYVDKPTVAEGVIFALGENLGYDKFENVRWSGGNLGDTAREDAIMLMYQLYPAFGEEMWPFFENWNFPVDEDTDNDGLTNWVEIELGFWPVVADMDSDGLSDGEELALGTNPFERDDSDNDGLSDGAEIKVYGTDPLSPDTDNDGLTDGDEIFYLDLNPLLYDTDNDGISDYDEAYPQRGSGWSGYLWLTLGVLITALVLLLLLRRRRGRSF